MTIAELDIRATQRSDHKHVAVRWLYKPTAGNFILFPPDGFKLEGLSAAGAWLQIAEFHCPGLTNGKIDPKQLIGDASVRLSVDYQAPDVYILQPDIQELAGLIPHLTLSAKTDDDEHPAAILQIVRSIGFLHLTDATAKIPFQPGTDVRDIDRHVTWQHGSAEESAVYSALFSFYRDWATNYLLSFAKHFAFAKILGIAYEDNVGHQKYRVSIPGGSTSRENDPSRSDEFEVFTPQSEDYPDSVQDTSLAPYPALLTGWQPRVYPAPQTPLRVLLDRCISSPPQERCVALNTSWECVWQLRDDDWRLLPLLPIAYRVSRDGNVLPKFDFLLPCSNGRPDDHFWQGVWEFTEAFDHTTYAPGRQVVYEVSAIDQFGRLRRPIPIVGKFLDDQLGPPPPMPVVIGPKPIALLEDATVARVTLDLMWNRAAELDAPDVDTHTVAFSGETTILGALPVYIAEVREFDNANPLYKLQCDLVLEGALSRDLQPSSVQTPTGVFMVVGVNASGSLRVYKIAGRSPIVCDARLTFTKNVKVAETKKTVSRPEPIVCEVTLLDCSRVEGDRWMCRLRLDHPKPPDMEATFSWPLLGSDIARLVVHAGEASFEVPDTNVLFTELHPYSVSERSEFVDGSPALLLPIARVSVDVPVPQELDRATLPFSVWSEDEHGNLGDESAPKSTVEVVRPRTPIMQLKPRSKWAKRAAEFDEQAIASLSWPAVANASRFEVESLLSTRVPGADLLDDDQLRQLAETDAYVGGRFQRVSNAVFGNRFDDVILGRAPVRVVHRVRPVSVTEVAGDWQYLGVYHVPDIRIPSTPSISFAGPPSEGDIDRRLLFRWSYLGDVSDVHFDLQSRSIEHEGNSEGGWLVVDTIRPGAITPEPGQIFRKVIENRTPGLQCDWRIIAIRTALDPLDPLFKRMHEIRSIPSHSRRLSALGALNAPSWARIDRSQEANGKISLFWSTRDTYRSLELRVRGPADAGYRVSKLQPKDTTVQVDISADPQGGWTFQLLAATHQARIAGRLLSLSEEI